MWGLSLHRRKGPDRAKLLQNSSCKTCLTRLPSHPWGRPLCAGGWWMHSGESGFWVWVFNVRMNGHMLGRRWRRAVKVNWGKLSGRGGGHSNNKQPKNNKIKQNKTFQRHWMNTSLGEQGNASICAGWPLVNDYHYMKNVAECVLMCPNWFQRQNGRQDYGRQTQRDIAPLLLSAPLSQIITYKCHVNAITRAKQ